MRLDIKRSKDTLSNDADSMLGEVVSASLGQLLHSFGIRKLSLRGVRHGALTKPVREELVFFDETPASVKESAENVLDDISDLLLSLNVRSISIDATQADMDDIRAVWKRIGATVTDSTTSFSAKPPSIVPDMSEVPIEI